jgi:hypothetical protein
MASSKPNVRPQPPLLVLALLGLSFSGCVFPDGGTGSPFEALDAPRWEAGYGWTYDVVASSQSTGFDDRSVGGGSDSDRAKVSLKVLNTTKMMGNRPVYVLSVDDNAEHPMFEGDLQAIDQQSLAVVARAYHTGMYPGERGTPACRGYSPLQPVSPEEDFPGIRFPIDDGLEYTGSLGFDDPLILGYTTKVYGLVDVNVPAGRFRAVYITTEFKPGELPQEAEGHLFDVNMRIEQWYSPDARYLVKHVFSASAVASNGGQNYRFAFRTTAVLASYSLEAGPEQESPEIEDRTHEQEFRYRSTQLVSDTAFPVNVADGPTTARITLQETKGEGHWGGRILRVEELAPIAYNKTTHEIAWTVSRTAGGYYQEEEFVGDVLELPMERGGNTMVQALLRPVACGMGPIAHANGMADAYWERTFTFETSPGLPQTKLIGEFPVEDGAMQGLASWTRQGRLGYSPDSGQLVIRDGAGSSRAFSASQIGQADFGTYPPGLFAASWATSNPVNVGEVIELKVTVSYGYIPYH